MIDASPLENAWSSGDLAIADGVVNEDFCSLQRISNILHWTVHRLISSYVIVASAYSNLKR